MIEVRRGRSGRHRPGLLAGEDGAVSTDPHDVSHHVAGAETSVALRAWYDFAVGHGDLLEGMKLRLRRVELSPFASWAIW